MKTTQFLVLAALAALTLALPHRPPGHEKRGTMQCPWQPVGDCQIYTPSYNDLFESMGAKGYNHYFPPTARKHEEPGALANAATRRLYADAIVGKGTCGPLGNVSPGYVCTDPARGIQVYAGRSEDIQEDHGVSRFLAEQVKEREDVNQHPWRPNGSPMKQ